MRETGRAVAARIDYVLPDSPAYDAGFEPGCYLTAVDGQPIRDIIDWRWLTAEESIVVSYIDLDGETGEVDLWREPGEDWGFEFDGLVFDGVKQCRNACTFCFMHQLPKGMRRSLYLRDDDFRLSFLVGTFVTLTNLSEADEARIVEQHISPLRMSLQVSNPDVRSRLIGKHAQHGIDALERLLAAGIEFHVQIVLVPGENDGDVLRETLDFAYARPGILGVGIVPLGYTKHQSVFDRSFNDEGASRALLDTIAPYQQRALTERGNAWVFAADEFYRNAWRNDLLEHLPPTSHYGDFSMFEDGIGIIRSTVDDWHAAEASGAICRCAKALEESNTTAIMVAGCAQREFLDALIAQSDITHCFKPLYVENDYFGGNVDVTGLLVGQDIVRAVTRTADDRREAGGLSLHAEAPAHRYGGAAAELARCARSDSPRQTLRLRSSQPQSSAKAHPPLDGHRTESYAICIPRVIFNDDLLTLDDMLLEDMEREAGVELHVVSCSPLDYFEEITALMRVE